MTTSTELTTQGIAALKAGDKVLAYRLLTQSLDVNLQNELAWLWLSGVVQDDTERKYCLEQVLKINPGNEAARRGLFLFPAGITSKSPISSETIPQPSIPIAPPRQEQESVQVNSESTHQPSIPIAPPDTLMPSANRSSVKNYILASVGIIAVLSIVVVIVGLVAFRTPTKSHAIGETVIIGTTTWIVSDSAVTSSLGDVKLGITANATGRFLIVRATISNKGTKADNLMTPKLVNERGQEVEETTDVMVYIQNPHNCLFAEITPGTSKECWFIYDIPSAPHIWTLKAQELGIIGENVYILVKQ